MITDKSINSKLTQTDAHFDTLFGEISAGSIVQFDCEQTTAYSFDRTVYGYYASSAFGYK